MKKAIHLSPLGLHQLRNVSEARRKALAGVWRALVWPQTKPAVPAEIEVTFRFDDNPRTKFITGEMVFESWQDGRGRIENYFAGGFKTENHLVFGYTKKHDNIIGWGSIFFEMSPDSRKMTGRIVGVSSHSGEHFYSDAFLVKGADADLTPYRKTKRPTIFIGHGRSIFWKTLQRFLERNGYTVITYESGARAGKTVSNVLESILGDSSFALLVLTGDDKMEEGSLRPRQNVVHEIGLFQGKLGIGRAIILLEDGVEEFSNVKGINYIEFRKNKISDAFKDIVATIQREFPPSEKAAH